MSGRSTAPRVDPGVWEHPKTQAVARMYGVPPDRVVWYLTRMWSSVLRRKSRGLLFTISGDEAFQQEILRDFRTDVGVGKPSTFLRALINAGFVDQDGAELWVHDWSDWQGGVDPRVERRLARARADINSKTGDSYSGTGSLGTTGMVTGTGDYGYTGTTGSDSTGSRIEDSTKSPGVGKGGSGGEGFSTRKTTGEGPDSSAPFTRFMWWITKGFVDGAYQRDTYDPSHLTKTGDGVDMALVAECYIAIDRGLFGDDFDQRNLTARHAMKKFGAFAMFKRRKRVNGTIIPLTPAGAAWFASAQGSGGQMATGDAGASAGRHGSTYSTAGVPGTRSMDQHPKLRDLGDRQAPGDTGLAF